MIRKTECIIVVQTNMDQSGLDHLLEPCAINSAAAMPNRHARINRALQPVPARFHSLLRLLTDSHCHIMGLQLTNEQLIEHTTDHNMQVGSAREYIFMSVRAADWKVILGRVWADAVDSTKVRPAFGVHPWWAHEIDPNEDSWLGTLEQCLRKIPSGIVGEIGLDRNQKCKEFFKSHQIPVFTKQLRVAVALSRPVSIHCFKSDGALVDIFEEEASTANGLPPCICLHSFSGSIETLKRIICIVEAPRDGSQPSLEKQAETGKFPRVFVGLNMLTNLSKKGANMFLQQLVTETEFGITRLLVESDYDFTIRESYPRDADKLLLNAVITISDMLNLEPEAVASKIAQNMCCFLRSLHPLE